MGCDIYRYEFSSGEESKVSAVSSPAASEYMPAIWKDRIAFARVYEHRRGRASYVTWVYTPGARQKVVQTLVTPEITNNALFSPSLAGDSLFFGEFNPDRTAASFVARYSTAKPSLSYAPVDGNLVSQSTAAARTFTVRHAGAFLVTEYDGLTFSPGLPPPSP